MFQKRWGKCLSFFKKSENIWNTLPCPNCVQPQHQCPLPPPDASTVTTHRWWAGRTRAARQSAGHPGPPCRTPQRTMCRGQPLHLGGGGQRFEQQRLSHRPVSRWLGKSRESSLLQSIAIVFSTLHSFSSRAANFRGDFNCNSWGLTSQGGKEPHTCS